MNSHTFSACTGIVLSITPAGCFYAVQSPVENNYRRVLLELMQHEKSMPFNDKLAQLLTGYEKDKALTLINNMESAGFVSAQPDTEYMPSKNLELLLPELIPEFSDQQRVVLCDSGRGFFLEYVGFSRNEVEELAVLSANLRTLYGKNSELFNNCLAKEQRAFGLIDPAGHSELGFWPLYIGNNTFTLVIAGIPQFDNRSFKELIWVLTQRYSQT